ncbi:hypothetical protein ACTVZO_39405 [Streptomyces sp. IBSNAI002]|uniref:hypothetical protein n=1 Tax=Streptomyces sp. IBSNAI002 TaxID=3457500 RepID=UPI003FD20C55
MTASAVGRDLAAMLDRHVPLGQDQAAVRMRARRTDFDHVVRLGHVSPVARAEDVGVHVNATPARFS